MHTALLIIDIQNDYFPGGAMELVRCIGSRQSCEASTGRISRKITACRSHPTCGRSSGRDIFPSQHPRHGYSPLRCSEGR